MWRERLTYLILRTVAVVVLVTAIAMNVVEPTRFYRHWLSVIIFVICIFLMWLARRRHFSLVNWATPLMIGSITLGAAYWGWIDVDLALGICLIVVALATYLLGLPAGILYGALVVVAAWVLARDASSGGILTGHANMTVVEHTLVLISLVSSIIILVKLVDNEIDEQHRVVQENASILARTNAELEQAMQSLRRERESLKQRIAERTAELEQTNAELTVIAHRKDEFLASISHELRTPLNAIMGLSEALEEGVYGALNERQRRSLEVVRTSGRHLLELINDLLDVAKIEAGQLVLARDVADLNSVCQSSLLFIRTAATRKRITVTFVADPNVPSVVVDARRIKQVLVNLLSNAVKFTDDGGQVGLEVKGDDTADEVHLTVWDTGIGIPAEYQQRLFTPFLQVEAGQRRGHNGTGLGLVIVKRIVELHGGAIDVESREGVGSRFTVRLPMRCAASTPANVAGAVEDGNDHNLPAD